MKMLRDDADLRDSIDRFDRSTWDVHCVIIMQSTL